ncbi:MAG TPA: hypothetical protein VFK10_12375 [Burkholderiaceae bacterium]|nr:hypothetical protein [Burkholderiaceae bacterium]
MSPTSLFNMSPELMRERGRHGMHVAPLPLEDDHAWIVGVCLALAFVVTLVFIGIR